jgi:plasmid stabilization system protein ParE
MRIDWSLRAVGHLEAIHDYISEDSPEIARQFIARLLDAPKRLEHHPDSGRRVPELPEADLSEVIQEGYRIIYRTTPHRVEIVAVVDGRRDLTRLSLPTR